MQQYKLLNLCKALLSFQLKDKIATCASKINSALNHLKYSQEDQDRQECCVDEQVKPLNTYTAGTLLRQLTDPLPEQNRLEYLVRVLTDRKYFKELNEPLESVLRAELASMQDVLSKD